MAPRADMPDSELGVWAPAAFIISAEPAFGACVVVASYLYNQYGDAADKVQLQISEVDASGRVVSSVTRPVLGTVPGENRSYFEVQVPASPSYKVGVQSFDFLDGFGQ
jgi:hypothetical protein